jgi:hypothetical protein
LPGGGQRFVEIRSGLLEGGLALLQVGILLRQGLALQFQLAPGGFARLKLRLVGLAARERDIALRTSSRTKSWS